MILSELITHLNGVETAQLTPEMSQQALSHLVTDSRQASPDCVFIGLSGTQGHGVDFAQNAIEKGACVILAEKQPGLVNMPSFFTATNNMGKEKRVPVLWVEQLSIQCAELASHFYDHPSQRIKVIGVTGTNGKTSTTHYIAQLLSAMGQKVALLGTLGNGWLNDLAPSPNTTLEVVSLNRWLANFVDQQADVVVMEVSSHAISMGRIEGIYFCGLALTQVTRDHLDFHQTERHYQDTKKQLFTDYPSNFQVLNLDDVIGQECAEMTSVGQKIGYAQSDANADLFALEVMFTAQGLKGTLMLNHQPIRFDVPLMGQFNLENMLCAIGVVMGLGGQPKQIEQALNHLQAVPGRMQCLKRDGLPTVIIDYAHTPDALQALLKAVSAHLTHPDQTLWVIFGCGGNRDQGKRPLMGVVAETFADKVVITDDNPRFESPADIARQIVSGMKSAYQVIHDRADAVYLTLKQACPQDVVVLAGKGHESTQEVAGQKIAMQDERLVKQAYDRMGEFN